MDKFDSSDTWYLASIAKIKGALHVGNLALYVFLALVGGGIGTIIVGMSPTTTVAAAVGCILIWLLVKNLLIPFYLASFSILALQEVEISPGSLLALFENFKRPGIPSLLEVSVVLLGTCFLVNYYLDRDRRRIPVFTPPFVVFCVLYCVALYVGTATGNNDILIKEDSKKFFFPIVYFICSINILTTRERISNFALFVLMISAAKAYLGILSYLRGAGFEYGDSSVIFVETADLILVVTVLVAIVARTVYGRITWQVSLVSVAVGAPLMFSLVYSNRRNAWLGILLALTLLFVRTPVRFKMRMATILSAAAVTGAAMVALAMALHTLPSGQDLKSRFASISDKGDKSNEAHVNEWVVTIEALREHPVVGLGFGSEHAPVPGDDTINRHTVHNALLMLYMKMGITAVVLFLWCMLRYVRFCVRSRNASDAGGLDWLRVGLFSTFAYWLVTLNVAPSWWYYREMCMMALVMAIVIRLSLLSDEVARLAVGPEDHPLRLREAQL